MITRSKMFLILSLLVLIAASAEAVTVANFRHDLHVSPGGKANSKIWVTNEKNFEQSVKLYLSDYMHFADGTNNFAKPGSLKRSNAEWISFSPSTFSLKPGMTIEVQIQVNAPDKDLEGSYWSMLMVEPVEKSEIMPTNQPGEIRSGVKVISRQGVQIRSHIINTGEMKARFFNQKIENRDGKRFFEVDLENTGSIFYRGDFWVELFSKEGYPVGKVSLSSRGVYPECSARFSADVTKFKKGDYTAVCVFDTRSNKVFGGKYQIKIQ